MQQSVRGQSEDNNLPVAAGATIAIRTPKYFGAKLGVVVAVATIGFILFRLAGASSAVPTGVVLSSESAALVSVKGLRVEGQDVLPEGWTPGGQAAGPAASESKPQATVGLKVGRPATLTAVLSVPTGAVTSCALEPRPHGACVVKARFFSATDLRCEFVCTAQVSKP